MSECPKCKSKDIYEFTIYSIDSEKATANRISICRNCGRELKEKDSVPVTDVLKSLFTRRDNVEKECRDRKEFLENRIDEEMRLQLHDTC